MYRYFRQRFIAVPVLLCVLFSGGCAAVLKPDLARLYKLQEGNSDQPPVVIIHGALGSRLVHVDGSKEAWPGSMRRILFSDYHDLRLEIDPVTLSPIPSTLKASGVTAHVGGRDFYARILSTLENIGGYTPGKLGTMAAHGEKRYYVFTYDWRQDNVSSARQLHQFLEAIRADYDNPSLKVDVIAHSMGGLIARYYARYGTTDVLDDNNFQVNRMGEDRIRRIVLLGTPNLGSLGPLRTLIRGYKVGLGVIPPEIVATFPSTYQLLPHAITQSYVNISGKALRRDQFSVDEFWKRFEFSVFGSEVRDNIQAAFDNEEEADDYLQTLQRYFDKHIERARRFSWSLTVPTPDSELRFIVFGGDCVPTPARAVVEDINGESFLRLRPVEIKNPLPEIDYENLMFEPGDGAVTKASLLARHTSDPTIARHQYSYFSVDHSVFLCEKHDQLTGNIDFQNNLLQALLSVDR